MPVIIFILKLEEIIYNVYGPTCLMKDNANRQLLWAGAVFTTFKVGSHCPLNWISVMIRNRLNFNAFQNQSLTNTISRWHNLCFATNPQHNTCERSWKGIIWNITVIMNWCQRESKVWGKSDDDSVSFMIRSSCKRKQRRKQWRGKSWSGFQLNEQQICSHSPD